MRSFRVSITLIALFAAQTVAAQVPHQFEANTPAVANEVNENFEHVVNAINQVSNDLETLNTEADSTHTDINNDIDTLQAGQNTNTTAIQSNAAAITANDGDITDLNSDINDINIQITTLSDSIDTNSNDIDSLESDVGTLETQVDTLQQTPTAVFESYKQDYHDSVTYSATSDPLGTEITVGDLEFRIVKVPFKEIGSGDTYTITYAQQCGANPCADPLLVTLSTRHVKDSGNGTLTIDGYPAHIQNITEYHNYNVFTNTSSNSYVKRIQSSVYVRVDETLININYDVSVSTVQGSAGTSDFTSVFDLNDVVHDTDLIQFIDDAIDYINIEPIL